MTESTGSPQLIFHSASVTNSTNFSQAQSHPKSKQHFEGCLKTREHVTKFWSIEYRWIFYNSFQEISFKRSGLLLPYQWSECEYESWRWLNLLGTQDDVTTEEHSQAWSTHTLPEWASSRRSLNRNINTYFVYLWHDKLHNSAWVYLIYSKKNHSNIAN